MVGRISFRLSLRISYGSKWTSLSLRRLPRFAPQCGPPTAIPIVIGGVDDAVEQGFVTSLAKPGGNVTANVRLQQDQRGVAVIADLENGESAPPSPPASA